MVLDRCPVQTDTGLWIRPAYRDGFDQGTITAVVRRRDRSDPKDPTFIPLDVDIPVRFIEQMGRRDANIQPKLFADDGTTVQIKRRIVKAIKDLTAEDLAGGTPDIAMPELVRYHLALVDNTVLPVWDEMVTVYQFEHRPKAVDPDA
jgi:hypothetical protein